VALGITPVLVGAHRWIAVLQAPDPAGLLEVVRNRTTGPIASEVAPPFVVVANNSRTLADALATANAGGKSLADATEFQQFRAAGEPGAPIRFLCELHKVWPRMLRKVRNSPNIWSVLLGCHVNHVVKTVGAISGSVSTRDGMKASLRGDIRPTDPRALTEGRPMEGVIAPPPGVALRLSVPRNLTRFWARRNALVADPLPAKLGELEQRAAERIPGFSVDQLVGQLGEAFDLYISASDSTAECGQRAPAMALVATLPESPPPSIVGALRSFFHLVGATLSGGPPEAAPSEVTRCYRGAELCISKDVPPLVTATVRGRLVVGNQVALVMCLIDSALDSELLPREEGDDIVVSGCATARVIAEARSILSSGWLSDRIGSEEDTTAFLETVERVLAHVRQARIRLDLEGKNVKLDIEVDAPSLWGPAEASR
jgi:hypothetical protein